METQLTDSALAELLSEVEAEIGDLLKSEKEKLSKAATDDDASADDSAPADAGSDSAPGADDSAPMADGAGSPAPADAAPDASDSAPEGSAPAMDGSAPADPAAAGPADPAMLEAEYAKLPPEELKAHYMAAKSALFKLMGAGGDAAPAPGADAGAPPAPAAPPAGPAASGPAMKMELDSIAPTKAGAGKDRLDPIAPTKADGGEDRLAAVAPTNKGELSSGKKLNINNNGQGDHSLGKSEREEFESLKSTVNGLMKAIEELAKPVRKAVTSVDFVPKAEVQETRALSKSEVVAKLKTVTADPSLKKSDRDLVNGYFDGKVDVGQIAHLLK